VAWGCGRRGRIIVEPLAKSLGRAFVAVDDGDLYLAVFACLLFFENIAKRIAVKLHRYASRKRCGAELSHSFPLVLFRCNCSKVAVVVHGGGKSREAGRKAPGEEKLSKAKEEIVSPSLSLYSDD
jgi:hypothetical protein